MKATRIIFLFSFLFCLATNAQNELPLQIDNSKIKPLQKLLDSSLQTNLRDELASHPEWNDLIVQKKMSVGLVDLSDPENVRFARVNGNHMMYAASLPKIAILLAAMDAIEKGELKETAEVKKDMRLMISKSDNSAATRMIDRVGYEKLESVMTDPKYAFYDEQKGGGLWVGKRYAAKGRRYPEPLKGLSHAATTRQVCSFYYQLAMGNLISTARSKEMLEIMKNPALHHKFVNTLDKIAPNADIYRKSGSWRNFHSDSALVWGPNRQYIIVALIDNDYGEQIIRKLVKPLERVLNK